MYTSIIDMFVDGLSGFCVSMFSMLRLCVINIFMSKYFVERVAVSNMVKVQVSLVNFSLDHG